MLKTDEKKLPYIVKSVLNNVEKVRIKLLNSYLRNKFAKSHFFYHENLTHPLKALQTVN